MKIKSVLILILAYSCFTFALDSLCSSLQSTLLSEKKRKRESDWKEENQMFVDQLYRWCLDDIGCKRMFFQETRQNLTIFKILLGDHFVAEEMNPEFAALKMICNKSSTEELVKTSWMYTLKNTVSNARIPLFCDINHQLIFDTTTLTYDCVCLPNRICDDVQYSQTFYYIIIVLFSVLLICLFFGADYYIAIETRLFAATIASNKGKNKLSRTAAAIKAFNNSQL